MRVLGTWEEPLFVESDVLKVLNADADSEAYDLLEDFEKGVITIEAESGCEEYKYLTESGFYMMVIGSDTPEAKTFKKRLFEEILPEIRRSKNLLSFNNNSGGATTDLKAFLLSMKTQTEGGDA